jgi:antitoxin (DNA-binding transcriptional repressor) of toxin-antitoxin stability system
MRSVGIKMLKNKLSEYLRLVSNNGETVFVTDHDRIVAEIKPPQQGQVSSISDKAILNCIESGLISPKLSSSMEVETIKQKMPIKKIMEDLAKDRS